MVRSSELVSNGLKSTLNCQNFDGQNWNADGQKYPNEEKYYIKDLRGCSGIFSRD